MTTKKREGAIVAQEEGALTAEEAKNVSTLLARYRPHIPDEVLADQSYLRRSFMALSTIGSRKLFACDAGSVVKCLVAGHALGLEFNTLNEMWLIPRAGELTYQIGYKGLIKLAMRSGQYSKVDAQVVREGDAFTFDLAEGRISHSFDLFAGGRDSARYVGVYAVAVTKDGEQIAEVMTRDECEHVRDKTSKARSGPWYDWPEQMARKTVLRRLCNRLEMTTAASAAIAGETYDTGHVKARAVRADASAIWAKT